MEFSGVLGQVAALRATRLSYGKIGEALGLSKGQVAGMCRRAGLIIMRKPELAARISAGRRRTSSIYDPANIAEARRRWNGGAMAHAVADWLGVSKDCFRHMRYREGGFELRHGGPVKGLPKPRAPRTKKPKAAPAPPLPITAAPAYKWTNTTRCVFPIGEWRRPGFRWCDAVVEGPGPYCTECAAKCYQRYTRPPPQKR